MTSIGKNIAYFRKKAGFTQEELSEKMNITSQAVSKWENDLSYPDLTSAKMLADILHVSIDELINGATNCTIATNASAEQISRRILLICAQVDEDEYSVEKATNVIVRIPVSVLLNAYENGTLGELVGDYEQNVEKAIGMIKEGVMGTLVDVQAEGCNVQIKVEDYEN